MYGFSFRTASTGGLAIANAGAITITTGPTTLPTTTAFTAYPTGQSLPGLTPANDTRYCYVIKLDNARLTTDVYPGVTTTVAPVLANTSAGTAVPFYYGNPAPSNQSTLSQVVQFLGTTNKQW